MKHLQLFEAASAGNLMDVKRGIYSEAKKEYMSAVATQLKAAGIRIKKTVIKNDDIDFFTNDYFECSYLGTNFKITMSNRGVSLGTDINGLYGYSTTVETLVKKLEKLLG